MRCPMLTITLIAATIASVLFTAVAVIVDAQTYRSLPPI